MTGSAHIPSLSSLGRRIMICGPSTAGKSTLAVAIGRKLDIPVAHIDLFRHLPDTDWVRRDDAAFHRLHDEAIAADEWVMDGNYSELFPQRLKRATGIILVGHHRIPTFLRYLRRTLFQKDRPGSLAGDKDTLKWSMVHWILVASPRNLRRHRAELPRAGLPFVEVRGMRGLNELYDAWAWRAADGRKAALTAGAAGVLIPHHDARRPQADHRHTERPPRPRDRR